MFQQGAASRASPFNARGSSWRFRCHALQRRCSALLTHSHTVWAYAPDAGTPNFNGPYSGDHVAFVGCQGACGCCGGCCACGGPGCGCMPCGGCCGCPPGCGEQACVGCAPCGPCPCTPCGCEGSCVGCGSCAVCGGCMPGSGPCGPGCPGCGPGGPCGPGPCGPCGCSNGCGLQPCGVPNVSDSPTFEGSELMLITCPFAFATVLTCAGRKEDGSPAAR